ncbi:outer membrane beta-barrel protein [candidate division CSSED10-310 bacterium]|uniref:Outer membrane beta-barrel protein n=1 Tax=candidate division CSSED10-310 bacterium TaxID=2855610 RepID=A0ABV6YXU2_UNCC1
MRKALLLLITLAIFITFAETTVAASFGVGAHFAWYKPKDVEESSVFFGLQSRFRLGSLLALEGSIDYYYEEMEEDYDFIMYPVQVSLMVTLIDIRILRGYVMGGLGWFYWELDGPLQGEEGHEPSYHAGAGVELQLSKHFAFHGDIRYVYFSPDIDIGDWENWSGAWSTIGCTIYF